MSIRLKLLLSQMIMALIPIALLIVMNFFIPASFIRGLENNFNKRPPAKPGAAKVRELNVTQITSMNFKTKSDFDNVKEIDEQLNQLDQGIVIRKNNKIIYKSSFLNKSNIEKQLPKFGVFFEEGGTGPSMQNGEVRPYIIKQKDIYFKDGSTGSVFLIIKTKPIVQPFNRTVQYLLAMLAVVVILINGIIIIIITRGIIKPIESLKKAARQIKNSNLNYELKSTSKDELGELCNDFEEMRIKLKESLELQQQYELNRVELISNISHDLKTPITSIKGYIEGVIDGVANSPEKVEKYLKTAYAKVNAMDLLIDELFLFSRLDLKKLPFDFEQVNIREYLEDCYAELLLDAEEKNIVLNYDVETEGQPIVLADRDKLHRVITNIVGNAIKYMGKDYGQISINLKDDGEYVVIKIQDNGQGISQESLPFIFDRFYRTDSSRNSSTGGSGLGLAIVKRIVEEHNGRIWAESIEGVGTSIFFTLNKVIKKEGDITE